MCTIVTFIATIPNILRWPKDETKYDYSCKTDYYAAVKNSVSTC